MDIIKKCLLWGFGNCFLENINMVRYHEMRGHFQVIGITANSFGYSEWGGYRFVDIEERKCLEYDFIIIMAKDRACREIMKEALECGIPQEKIFTYRILRHEKIELDRYIQIRKEPLTIFSNNCWGGITYHSLDMEFFSPLVNMWIEEQDYMTFLINPQYYIEQDIEFIEMKVMESGNSYPLAKCGDIILHFNHHNTYEDAKESWEKRKKRINWNNLFVEMHTWSEFVADEFMELPYKRKICFVPFKTNGKSLIYIPYRENERLANVHFWEIVNGMARGKYPYYDVLDLIENGKITIKKDFFEQK